MSLYESGESNGSVSLSELFDGAGDIEGYTDTGLEDVAYYICRGGWPRAMNMDRDIALEQAVDYFDAVVSSDISRVDNVSRDEQRTRGLLRSYARAVGTQTTISSIRKDMLSDDSQSPSEDTVSSYIAALRKIFVLGGLPGMESQSAFKDGGTHI